MDKIVRNISDMCGGLSIPTSDTILYVSIPKQELQVYLHGKLKKTYIISTSSRNPSNLENSAGTPTGLHRVEQKVGANTKAGTVFFARVSTDTFFWDFSEDIQSKNLITTRIMWLKGLEPGKNSGDGVDSFCRYIYIHGTNHEERLGYPASGGCILLSNEEIIRLFDKVPTGSLVFIDETQSIS